MDARRQAALDRLVESLEAHGITQDYDIATNYLSENDAMARVGCSRDHLRQLEQDGTLQALRNGRGAVVVTPTREWVYERDGVQHLQMKRGRPDVVVGTFDDLAAEPVSEGYYELACAEGHVVRVMSLPRKRYRSPARAGTGFASILAPRDMGPWPR